uniref:Uncharacterized protein n=1 Tax=Rhizophora mucronata TaxID=61149 RepID=A0A2P2J9M7_RHIMU
MFFEARGTEMATLFPNSRMTTGRDEVYVAAVPLRATKGPAQLLTSAAFSLKLWDLQHFMVIIKPSSPTSHSQVLCYSFFIIVTWVLYVLLLQFVLCLFSVFPQSFCTVISVLPMVLGMLVWLSCSWLCIRLLELHNVWLIFSQNFGL